VCVDQDDLVGLLASDQLADEIVLIGAHLDSWDVGAGAIDDGAGCAIVLETVRLIKAMGLTPRRTIRVVLFMNEENGLSGAKAYAETHKAEIDKHVVALEADSGGGRPTGLSYTVESAKALMQKIAPPLAGLGAHELRLTDDGGADLLPITERVPIVNIDQDVSDYFDWHHTTSDTLDKIIPLDINLTVAAFAGLTYTPRRTFDVGARVGFLAMDDPAQSFSVGAFAAVRL